ncbi:hypothetical protein IJU85_00560 [Candidatus Saccharibacteria bacterium]|nr:hypothetical protein [Candidatus Saccharibacteria bacterium]
MAETFKIPTQVVDSDWKDDIDVDYAIHGGNEKNEREFVSPDKVSDQSIESIKDWRMKKWGRLSLKAYKDAA